MLNKPQSQHKKPTKRCSASWRPKLWAAVSQARMYITNGNVHHISVILYHFSYQHVLRFAICYWVIIAFKNTPVLLMAITVLFLSMCLSPNKNRFNSAAHFSAGLWKEKSYWDVIEKVEEGGDNLGTGGFGKVHFNHRAMSARHLDTSFTATSHTDSPLMRPNTLHITVVCHRRIPAWSMDAFQRCTQYYVCILYTGGWV